MVLSSAIYHVAGVAGGTSVGVLCCFWRRSRENGGIFARGLVAREIPCDFAAKKVPQAHESRQLRGLYPMILKPP